MSDLISLLKEAGITQEDLCHILNLNDLNELNNKFNGISFFSVKEAIIIKNLINDKLNTMYIIEDLFPIEKER